MRRVLLITMIPLVILVGVLYWVLHSMGSFVTQSNPFIKDYTLPAKYTTVHEATWQVINTNPAFIKTVPVYDSQHYDYYNDSVHYITINIALADHDTCQFEFHFLGDSASWANDKTNIISLKQAYALSGQQLTEKQLTNIFEQQLIAKVENLVKAKPAR